MALEAMSLEERRARSGLVLVVPEVNGLVGGYLRRYSEAGANVPPHITLLSPFLAPSEVTSEIMRRLEQVIGGAPVFRFSLARLARFSPGSVVYLAPEPAAPFVELITRLRQAFPEVPSYWDEYDEIVPHLTVADLTLTDDNDLQGEIEGVLTAYLPVQCMAHEAVLLQRVRPAPAPWDVRGRFSLAPSGEQFDTVEK